MLRYANLPRYRLIMQIVCKLLTTISRQILTKAAALYNQLSISRQQPTSYRDLFSICYCQLDLYHDHHLTLAIHYLFASDVMGSSQEVCLIQNYWHSKRYKLQFCACLQKIMFMIISVIAISINYVLIISQTKEKNCLLLLDFMQC